MSPQQADHTRNAPARETSAQPRAESLRRAFSWNLLATVVVAGCQWGMLAILARLGELERAETELGIFVHALAIAAPLVLLASMQTRALLAADAAEQTPFAVYLSQRVWAMVAVVVAATLWGAVVAAESLAIIACVACARAIEGVSELIHGRFQRAQRSALVTASQLLRGPLGLLALGLGCWLGGALWVGCVALVGSSLIVLVTFDLPAARAVGSPQGAGQLHASSAAVEAGEGVQRPTARIGKGTEASGPPQGSALGAPSPAGAPSTAWQLTRVALPLGLVSGVVSLTTNLPRYIIESEVGVRELAVFAAMAYAMVAIAQFVQSLSAAALPRLGHAWIARDLPRLRALTWKTVGISTLPGLAAIPICIVWGGPILAVLYRPEFAGHGHLLWWFCLLGVLSALAGILRTVMTACGVLDAQLPLAVATGVLTAVGTLMVLPWGAIEAGIAGLLAGRVLQVLAHGWMVVGIFRRLEAPAKDTMTSPSPRTTSIQIPPRT